MGFGGILSSLIILLVGCGSQQPQVKLPMKVAQFAWLKGTWANHTPRGDTYESWQVDDSGLTGRSYSVTDGDTVVTERLWIIQRDSVVYYVAHPRQNEQPTYFSLVRADSTSAVFANDHHDFPTRITYVCLSTDSMTATAEGPHADTVLRIEFGSKRAK